MDEVLREWMQLWEKALPVCTRQKVVLARPGRRLGWGAQRAGRACVRKG